MTKYISVTETAKLIRLALKENFKGIKFSVRSSSYAGGASINVSWVDGPCDADVEAITKQFQGATFDSSIDLQSYVYHEFNGEQVHFGSDYVMTRRNFSRLFMEAVTKQFCVVHGIPMLEIGGSDNDAWANTRNLDISTEHWFRDLLHTTDAKDMFSVYEGQEARKQRQADEWERGAAERERKAKEAVEKERQAREAADRKRQEQQSARERQQREQQQREHINTQKYAVLATKASALAYLGLTFSANKQDILQAFRDKVKASADGKGGYTGDMDLLVKAKEKALS